MHGQLSCTDFYVYVLIVYGFVLGSASEEDLGTSEEEGKDWDDLEKEAREGA